MPPSWHFCFKHSAVSLISIGLTNFLEYTLPELNKHVNMGSRELIRPWRLSLRPCFGLEDPREHLVKVLTLALAAKVLALALKEKS